MASDERHPTQIPGNCPRCGASPKAADEITALRDTIAKLEAENERQRACLEDIIGTWERNKTKPDDEWEDGYEDALAECARKCRGALLSNTGLLAAR